MRWIAQKIDTLSAKIRDAFLLSNKQVLRNVFAAILVVNVSLCLNAKNIKIIIWNVTNFCVFSWKAQLVYNKINSRVVYSIICYKIMLLYWDAFHKKFFTFRTVLHSLRTWNNFTNMVRILSNCISTWSINSRLKGTNWKQTTCCIKQRNVDSECRWNTMMIK